MLPDGAGCQRRAFGKSRQLSWFRFSPRKACAGSFFAVPGAKIKKDFGSYENCAIFAPSFADA